jgi:acetolactate synthase-1/2/3 large subunit
VVGSGNFHVTNALIAGGARFIAARHEGGATVMADAWARTTGMAGMVTVHQGPGLAAAVGAVAMRLHSPASAHGSWWLEEAFRGH